MVGFVRLVITPGSHCDTTVNPSLSLEMTANNAANVVISLSAAMTNYASDLYICLG